MWYIHADSLYMDQVYLFGILGLLACANICKIATYLYLYVLHSRIAIPYAMYATYMRPFLIYDCADVKMAEVPWAS